MTNKFLSRFFVLLCIVVCLQQLPSSLAEVQCSNGSFCQDGQTCTGKTSFAGLLFGCSPVSNAVFCRDNRYSCPSSTVCSRNSTQCLASNGQSSSPSLLNVNSTSYSTDESTVCSLLRPQISSYCDCRQRDSLAAFVMCPEVDFLGFESFFVQVEIYPCSLYATESKKHNTTFALRYSVRSMYDNTFAPYDFGSGDQVNFRYNILNNRDALYRSKTSLGNALDTKIFKTDDGRYIYPQLYANLDGKNYSPILNIHIRVEACYINPTYSGTKFSICYYDLDPYAYTNNVRYVNLNTTTPIPIPLIDSTDIDMRKIKCPKSYYESNTRIKPSV